MKTQIAFGLIVLLVSTNALADAGDGPGDRETQLAALAQYDMLSLGAQEIQSSTAGLVIDSENLTFVGLYTQHRFGKPLEFGYPETYHSIDVLLDGKINRYQYILIVQRNSDEMASGGIDYYQIGAVLGYEVIKDSGMSLVLGGGLAMGKFSEETTASDSSQIIPVPLVRFNYSSERIAGKFEFLTSPNLDFTLFPKDRFRVLCDFRLDHIRDARDAIFELRLEYRLFRPDSPRGDFAGVSLGVTNANVGEFNIGHPNGETLEAHYYSVFAMLDLSIIKATAGYAFGGRELYRGTIKRDVGEGAFFSIQGAMPF